MTPWRQLALWARRARPSRGRLAAALTLATVTQLAATALLVGALSLLAFAQHRPSWRAIAVALVVIEVLSFTRSPLRYKERLSTHELGFSAVTQWRRWLTATVLAWPLREFRGHHSGDLVERALHDTDELQDLWLRGVIPVSAATFTAVLTDAAVAIVGGGPRWLTLALTLFVVQTLGLSTVLRRLPRLSDLDAQIRRERALVLAELHQAADVGADLALLGGEHFLRTRYNERAAALRNAEATAERHLVALTWIAPLCSVAAVVSVALAPRTSGVALVAVTLVALTTFELLEVARHALTTATRVIAATRRLDALRPATPPATNELDCFDTVATAGLSLLLDGREIPVADVSLGRGERLCVRGPSGAGKSTLLALLAAMDLPTRGEVLINGASAQSFSEDSLRSWVRWLPEGARVQPGLLRDVLGLGRPVTPRDIERLAALGLALSEEDRVGELSRGEQQRLGVARALVGSPQLLVLDEPTSGLGDDDTRRTLGVLERSGATIIVASHDERVARWCGRTLSYEGHAFVLGRADGTFELRDEAPSL